MLFVLLGVVMNSLHALVASAAIDLLTRPGKSVRRGSALASGVYVALGLMLTLAR